MDIREPIDSEEEWLRQMMDSPPSDDPESYENAHKTVRLAKALASDEPKTAIVICAAQQMLRCAAARGNLKESDCRKILKITRALSNIWFPMRFKPLVIDNSDIGPDEPTLHIELGEDGVPSIELRSNSDQPGQSDQQ